MLSRFLRSGSATKTVVTFFAIVASAVATFAFQTVAARQLGALQFGQLSFALTLLTIASLVVPLGFPTVLLKYLSRYVLSDDRSLYAQLWRTAKRTVMLASAICVSALLLYALLFGAEARLVLILIAVVVPLAALVKLNVSVLRVSNRTTAAVLLETPFREGAAFVGLLVLVACTTYVTPFSVAVIYSFAVLLGYLITQYFSRAHVPGSEPFQLAPDQRREWFSVAFSALLITTSNLLFRRVDVLIIGTVNDYASAGIYSAALRLSDVVQMPLVAANVVAASRISSLYAAGRMEELSDFIRKMSAIVLLMCATLSLPLLLFPSHLLSIFGLEFSRGKVVLVSLVLGQLVNAATGCVTLLLTMTSYEWRAAVTTSIVGLLTCASNVFLASAYGMNGVGIGSAVALVVLNIAYLIVAYRATGILALPMWRVRRDK